MSGTPHCPDSIHLPDFLAGTLAENLQESLIKHIDRCQLCQQELELLTSPIPDDELSDSQRKVWQDLFSGEDLFSGGDADSENSMGMVWDLTGSMPRFPGQPSRTTKILDQTPPDIPGYEIYDEIARGGMGRIYRARHISLDREVAIKFMRPTDSPDMTARFEQEMAAVGKLEHHHIVRAYDAGQVEGTAFIVMELLDGSALNRWLSKPSKPGITAETRDVSSHATHPHSSVLTVDEACNLIRQAALGLEAAHDAGLIHRDIKPSNLLVTSDGVVKLLDLGLVESLSQRNVNGQTMDDAVVWGSLDYVAPELCFGGSIADHRADIYGLGCTFFAILTGLPPFADVRSPRRKLLAHGSKPRPDVRLSRSDIPEEIAVLIQQMMAIEPAARPQSASTVIEQLSPYCENQSATLPHPQSVIQQLLGNRLGLAWAAVTIILGVIILIRLKDGTKKRVELDDPVEAITIQNVEPATTVNIERAGESPPLELDAKAFPHFVRSLEVLEGKVRSFAFLPDHKRAIITIETGQLLIWNLATGKIEKRISTPAERLRRIAVTPNGEQLVLGGGDGLRLLRLSDESVIWHIPLRYPESIQVSPDGKFLVQSGLTRLQTLKIESGELIKHFGRRNLRFHAPAFSPDGKLIAFLDKKAKETILADPLTGKHKHTLTVDDFAPKAVAFFQDDQQAQHVIAIDQTKTVIVWEAQSGKQIHKYELPDDTWQEHLLPTGKAVVSIRGQDGTELVIWNPLTGKDYKRFAVPSTEQVVISPDETLALTKDKAKNAPIRLWRLTK